MMPGGFLVCEKFVLKLELVRAEQLSLLRKGEHLHLESKQTRDAVSGVMVSGGGSLF